MTYMTCSNGLAEPNIGYDSDWDMPFMHTSPIDLHYYVG